MYLKLKHFDNLVLATTIVEKLRFDGGFIFLKSADTQRADKVVFLSDNIMYHDKGELYYNHIATKEGYGIFEGNYCLELEELEADNFSPIHFENRESLVEYLDSIYLSSRVMAELTDDNEKDDLEEMLRSVIHAPYMPLVINGGFPNINPNFGININTFNLDDDD